MLVSIGMGLGSLEWLVEQGGGEALLTMALIRRSASVT